MDLRRYFLLPLQHRCAAEEKFTEFLSVAGGAGVTCSDRNSFSRVWCGKSEVGHFSILQLRIKT